MGVVERAHPDIAGFRPGTKSYKRFVNRYKRCLPYVFDKTVLDVPCGTGWGTAMFTESVEVHGLDRSEEAIDYGMENYPRLKLRVGDMLQMPYDGGYFHVVTCLEGYEHVAREDQRTLVVEISRVLKSSGLLAVTVPLAGFSKNNKFHLHEPTRAEFLEDVELLFNTLMLEDTGGVLWFVGQLKS